MPSSQLLETFWQGVGEQFTRSFGKRGSETNCERWLVTLDVREVYPQGRTNQAILQGCMGIIYAELGLRTLTSGGGPEGLIMHRLASRRRRCVDEVTSYRRAKDGRKRITARGSGRGGEVGHVP